MLDKTLPTLGLRFLYPMTRRTSFLRDVDKQKPGLSLLLASALSSTRFLTERTLHVGGGGAQWPSEGSWLCPGLSQEELGSWVFGRHLPPWVV